MDFAALALRFVLGFIFLFAGLAKLRAPEDFMLAVANYRLLPAVAARPFARWLPRVELAAGLCLLVGLAIPVAAGCAAALLLAFVVAVAINLARGRVIDCGCAGLAAPKLIGPELAARNLVLASAAVLVAAAAPSTLAIPSLSLARSSAIATPDAIAVLVAATVGVVLHAVLDDARRLRTAMRLVARSAS